MKFPIVPLDKNVKMLNNLIDEVNYKYLIPWARFSYNVYQDWVPSKARISNNEQSKYVQEDFLKEVCETVRIYHKDHDGILYMNKWVDFTKVDDEMYRVPVSLEEIFPDGQVIQLALLIDIFAQTKGCVTHLGYIHDTMLAGLLGSMVKQLTNDTIESNIEK
jgi:hypothetical protein